MTNANFFFTVAVPEQAEVRSRYLGLFAKQLPADGQVGIGARLGSLLFLHVSGESLEALTEVAFSSDMKIMLGQSATLSLTLKNTGTIHVAPEGEVVLVSRGRVLETIALNPDQKKVLPDGVWNNSFYVAGLSLRDVGKIDVVAFVRYGVSGQTLSARTTLWYVPWWMVSVVSLFVIILVYTARRLRGSRRHLRSISK